MSRHQDSPILFTMVGMTCYDLCQKNLLSMVDSCANQDLLNGFVWSIGKESMNYEASWMPLPGQRVMGHCTRASALKTRSSS